MCNVIPILCRHWSRHVPAGAAYEAEWNAKFAEYEKKYAEDASELKSIISGELPAGWEKALPVSLLIVIITINIICTKGTPMSSSLPFGKFSYFISMENTFH